MMISKSVLHAHIISEIIAKGFAPSHKELAEHFGCSTDLVTTALKELEAYHGVVLHPHEPSIWAIHPFSLAPSSFYVRSEKGNWWANCAWCAFGVAALVDTDVEIKSTLGAHGDPVSIHIKQGVIQEPHHLVHFPIPMQNAWDNVVYTCSTMLIFQSEDQIDLWSSQHRISKGDVQSTRTVWEFAKVWYGQHLNKDWHKWSVQEAKAIFERFNLDHPIWQLKDVDNRF